MLRFVIITSVFLGLIGGLVADDTQVAEVALYGDRIDGRAKLMWKVARTWPNATIGFAVKKRRVFEPAEKPVDWQPLKSSPVLPMVIRKRVYPEDALSSAEQQRLKELTEAQITSRGRETSNAEAVKEFSAMSNDQLGLLWLRLSLNFELAMVFGFGTMDDGLKENVAYEYGLFAVGPDGIASADPLSTCVLSDELPALAGERLKPTAGEEDGVIRLAWSMPLKDRQRASLQGFNVYRKTEGEDAFKKIVDCATATTIERMSQWTVQDPEQPVKMPCTYKIKPVNMFDREMTAEVVFDYIPYIPLWADLVKAPPQLVHQADAKDRTVLSWQLDRKLLPLIGGYMVERLMDKAKGFVPLQQLSADTFSFKDGLQSDPAVYRLAVVPQVEHEPVYSNAVVILPAVGETKPATPEGLNATYDPQKSAVILTWKPNPTTDIKGYIIYAGGQNGELERQNSQYVTGNRYEFKVYDGFGQPHEFGLQAISTDNGQSDMNQISLYVPLKELPVANLRRYRIEDDNPDSITWEWKYPDNIKELAGFRLFRDGELVADEKQITVDMRKVTVSGFTAGQNVRFYLQAVSNFGTVSKDGRVKSYTPKEKE